MNKAILIGLCYGITLPITAFAQTACPVSQYERWEQYESYSRDPEAHRLTDTGKALGVWQAFAFIEKDDITLWWTFAVEPGTPVTSIVLTTTAGTYESELVMFATWAQRKKVFCPDVADPEYESMKIKGKQCVVAFARFPSEPKGNVVTWSIK